MMMMMMTTTMMMNMLMRLPLMVKILSIEKERIERGDFERDINNNEIFDRSETDADNVISVQNITNTILAYTPPALSFSTNIWANMVNLSNIEIPFVSTWKEGTNFSKGLTFSNKVEV